MNAVVRSRKGYKPFQRSEPLADGMPKAGLRRGFLTQHKRKSASRKRIFIIESFLNL